MSHLVKIANGFDLIVYQGGIIFKDNQEPPHYWKLSVTTKSGQPEIIWIDLGIGQP